MNISYGGGGHYYGNIYASPAMGINRIKMRYLTIEHSGSDGFNFGDNTILDEFTYVTSTKNVGTAGVIKTNILHYFDNTSDFSGNLGGDYLTVDGWDIDSDVIWKPLSVPALMKSHFTISNNALVTIEAGSSFIFDSDAFFSTDNTGAIKAIGSASEPIIFTGLEKTAGYSGGIAFGNNDSRNELAYTTIEYGGNYYKGNIDIKSDAYANIHNCTITDSSSYGIWMRYNASSNDNIDSINTFSNNSSGNVGRD